ncbi:unnamed protein product [Linum tenue]|uniref:Uncharacterized protein n=1 Tax=Linum tenue TaxID=586396 RepID=A0AAV0KT33_9ROSI|nr:unnamed protein product [Linum tenue]
MGEVRDRDKGFDAARDEGVAWDVQDGKGGGDGVRPGSAVLPRSQGRP